MIARLTQSLFNFKESYNPEPINKPFSSLKNQAYFATMAPPEEPEPEKAVNLKAVVLLKGGADMLIMQNKAVTGKSHEMHVDRSTGMISEHMDGNAARANSKKITSTESHKKEKTFLRF